MGDKGRTWEVQRGRGGVIRRLGQEEDMESRMGGWEEMGKLGAGEM